MIEYLDEFLDVIVDTYGNNKTKFLYQDLVLLSVKFTQNDNKLNKRGRPKKDLSLNQNNSVWELIMHYYSLGPTNYYKFSLNNNYILMHNGIIGMTANIEKIKFKGLNNGLNIINDYMLNLKKKKYEIMFKTNRIILEK